MNSFYRFITYWGLLCVGLVCLSCKTAPTVLSVTPAPEPAQQSGALIPLESRLSIVLTDISWAPVVIGNNSGPSLGAALAAQDSVMLLLDENTLRGDMENRVFQMLKTAAPETKILARERGTLNTLLVERGEVPFRTTREMGTVDAFGRPHFVLKGHPLNTEWLSKRKALKGAGAVVAIGEIKVRGKRLQELRDRRRGNCRPLVAALSGIGSQGKALFSEYQIVVNQKLSESFSRHLKEALTFWKNELGMIHSTVDPSSEAAGCLSAYGTFLDAFKPCLQGHCEFTPRLYTNQGGLIGYSQTAANGIPERCPVGLSRNYVKEMDELAARSVEDVLPMLTSDWAEQLYKLGAVERFTTGVVEFCAPRHRRFSKNDLLDNQQDVLRYVNTIGQTDIQAVWFGTMGQHRIPGIGPVRVLARVRAEGNDPVALGAELIKKLRKTERCGGGDEVLFQVAVIDVGTSEVVFMDLFFGEQLLCDDLAVGQP